MKALALLLLVGTANAEVLGRVESSKSTIELHTDKGICVGEARRALWVPKEGSPVVGCWVYQDGKFQVAFLDGDVALFPASVLKRPERL